MAKEIIEAETREVVSPKKIALAKPKADIDGFITQRQEFIKKVSAICVEGKDYHIIQGKKSLAKGGAEKIASIFSWQAKFSKDTEALEMLGDTAGLVAFKCILEVKGKFQGEGRGAALLSRNSNDPNKTLKMAQKSAYIDAVIRASGLSDFFTQDLEDMPAEEISDNNTVKPSHKQIEYISELCKQKGYTKEDILDLGFTRLTGGKGGTASELIDYLLKAPTKINPNGQEVLDEEIQDVADGIEY